MGFIAVQVKHLAELLGARHNDASIDRRVQASTYGRSAPRRLNTEWPIARCLHFSNFGKPCTATGTHSKLVLDCKQSRLDIGDGCAHRRLKSTLPETATWIVLFDDRKCAHSADTTSAICTRALQCTSTAVHSLPSLRAKAVIFRRLYERT